MFSHRSMQESQPDPIISEAGNVKRHLLSHWKENRFLYLFGLLLIFGLVLLFIHNPQILWQIHLQIYDAYLRAGAPKHTATEPIIVVVDDRSLQKLGQWPWPRYRLASLLRKISQAKPQSVALDLFFPEADRTSLASLQKEMKQDLSFELPLQGVPERYLDNDAVLAQAIAEGPFILGYEFLFSGPNPGKECRLHPLHISRISQQSHPADDSWNLITAMGVACNLPRIATSSQSSGFINIRPENDGVIRRIPLMIRYEGKIYPNLMLTSFLAGSKPERLGLRLSSQGEMDLTIDDRSIPLDEQGRLWIRFRGASQNYPHISAVDVYEGKFLDRLAGRSVLLGVTAGGLKDICVTPLQNVVPGVDILAGTLDTLLQGDFFRRPPWVRGAEILLAILLGLLFLIVMPQTRALAGFLLLLLCAVCIVSLSLALFHLYGFLFFPLEPLLMTAMMYTLISSFKYRQGERKLAQYRRNLTVIQEATIETIANIAENRDPETGGHIRRTQHYVRALAEHLKKQKAYRSILNKDYVEALFLSAPLHDLGKVGIPDSILLKPARLNQEEIDIMHRHTLIGNKILQAAAKRLGENTFLTIAKEISVYHHERWDGEGYPYRLRGEEIPLAGRLMAIADVYDAMISKRAYKEATPHPEVVETIHKGRGTLFDPILVDAFLEIQDEFHTIALRFLDDKKE